MGQQAETMTKVAAVSQMAENLIGSEIIRLGGEINEKIRQGEKIVNLTIGDFNPGHFPIPAELKNYIIEAYRSDETNYPPADGILPLRQAVNHFVKKYAGLEYANDEILIAGGARPLIYALYQTVVDAGDKVLFPVPSWNNNHYTHLSHGDQVFIETRRENNFMPTADELRPHIGGAALLALCSPLNPTGTVFTEEGLRDICRLVIEENERRKGKRKPLYLMYDQIYFTLTFGDTKHVNPVTLFPELKPYVIFIDGLSKAFAATGVRVGWSMGPKLVIDKMKSILGHVGAWSPKAEQVACAKYLMEDNHTAEYLNDIRKKVSMRLDAIYAGFMQLKEEGFPVDAIAPQAAIYLTVKIEGAGKTAPDGSLLRTTRDVTSYVLNQAGIAMVPFYAFGASDSSPWYRISVGTIGMDEIPVMINSLRKALSGLK